MVNDRIIDKSTAGDRKGVEASEKRRKERIADIATVYF
jgi:hypothetical protein